MHRWPSDEDVNAPPFACLEVIIQARNLNRLLRRGCDRCHGSVTEPRPRDGAAV
jgi:hypothetical protein